jgi:hypothetical protein
MKNIYQIKITLPGIEPPIWRLIQIPGDFTFYDLHLVIQILMRWTNDHLHEFEVEPIRIGIPDQNQFFFKVDKVENEDILTLERVISTEKTKFLYTYDFGDNWVHELLVEKIIASEQNMEHAVCLDGKRAGTPEDIGGVWGYEIALQIVETPPENPEDEDGETLYRRNWRKNFDPEHFELAEINQRLKYIKASDTNSLVEPLPDNEETSQQAIVKGKKIGRNEPCPCGSGKKYKKCCGR